MIERELDEIRLDLKWSKTCESFLNFVDNKLKDHQGLAPDPVQYPESWYINHLNRTIEPHVTLYQYVVNHQMQADSIAKHLGTASVTSLSYESFVETIRTSCQTIDHTNHKAVQEKSRWKALQAEFNRGRNGNRGGRTGGRGRNSGRGGGRQPNQTGRGHGKYHNWIPKEQFDNLDKEGYQCLIRDRISRGEIQANTSDTNPAPTAAPTNSNPTAPPTQIQVSGATTALETQSVLTGAVPSVVPPTSRSVSMAMVTPSRSSHGSTTAMQMESGPDTLLRQLMSNASARFPASTTSSYANDTLTTTFNGGNYQIRRMNYAYCLTQHALHHEYQGALVDSGANRGMAGSDTCILATIPHAFVDITGVRGEVLQRLPIVQGAPLVHTIDEGPIILIMSQYAHKPDSKSIHSKSQIEHFGGVVHDSAKSTGGQQLVVTHEGYTIPLHVRNGLYYMDMVPLMDDDMERYPHVFITADSPWNPDSLDEEFFFDAADTIIDIPGVQQQRDAREAVDLFTVSTMIAPPSLDTPITQARLASVLHSLSLMPQTLLRRLSDLDALLPNFGWVGKDQIRDTLEKTTQHYKADQRVPMRISVPVSPLLMFDAFRNGTQPIRSFPTFPLMTTGSLGMVDADSFRSTAVLTLSFLPVTPCPRRLNCPQP